MKTRHKILRQAGTCLLIAFVMGGCATKGPKRVTAYAKDERPIRAETDWAIEEAPRTEPGKLMDPEAVTYAQVPSRIIYMPGRGGIFGRQSSRQEVAYNLVPVGRTPEAIAAAPEMEKKEVAGETETSPTASVFQSVFMGSGGKPVRGVARRLGVLGKTQEEENRAKALLKRDELLRWTVDVGWVGFTEEVVVDDTRPAAPKAEIPEIEEVEPPKEPELFAPAEITEETDGEENKPGKENNQIKVDEQEKKPEKIELGELIIEEE
jgi:predicted DNA-binding transcriptional regulator